MNSMSSNKENEITVIFYYRIYFRINKMKGGIFSVTMKSIVLKQKAETKWPSFSEKQ